MLARFNRPMHLSRSSASADCQGLSHDCLVGTLINERKAKLLASGTQSLPAGPSRCARITSVPAGTCARSIVADGESSTDTDADERICRRLPLRELGADAGCDTFDTPRPRPGPDGAVPAPIADDQ